MAAPTILSQGTADQIARHVTPILEGRLGWAQLFSEPGAGSDLAGVTTRAERDGDRWVITGQKVWSSQARRCDYGMLLARTSFDVPKHKGISWFAFKLDQPGVTIRPLREMTGDDIFNEIFLDEAVVDDADLIGGEGNGWMVTQATLHFERTGIGAGGGMAGFPFPGPKGGFLGRRAGDAALDQPADAKLTLGYDDVVELARRLGRAGDPSLRQELSTLYTDTMTGLWNAQRGKAEASSGGGQALGSIAKLTQTRIVQRAARLAAQSPAPTAPSPGPTASTAAPSARPWCSRPPRPSTAAPTRSSATSSPSAPWGCPASRHPTGAGPTATSSGACRRRGPWPIPPRLGTRARPAPPAREAAADRRRAAPPDRVGRARRGRPHRARARADRALRGVAPVAAGGAAHPRGRGAHLRAAGRAGRGRGPPPRPAPDRSHGRPRAAGPQGVARRRVRGPHRHRAGRRRAGGAVSAPPTVGRAAPAAHRRAGAGDRRPGGLRRR